MKRKILASLAVACFVAMCTLSCNRSLAPDQTAKENASVVSTQPSPENPTQAPKTPNGPTETTPSADLVACVFTDYNDFLLFGSEGTIDSSKYENADIMLAHYRLDKDAFVDLKKLLGLDPASKNGYKEMVDVTSNNQYTYYVSSENAAHQSVLEFYITVTSHDDVTQETAASVTTIDQISDMRGHSGTFVYRTDGYKLSFYKEDAKYKCLTLSREGLSISITFKEMLEESEISALCGKTVASLFADTTEEVKETLSVLSQRLPQAQAASKSGQ